ncbi:4-hydroxy-3-methylbut-2-enyl diphosphate reductase [Thermus sp.]|uniref:4-hydroxy-3-methylbut-2-enyl diphosphate reductase n=1 Tax=Thermus sp. TaxID=275 RepID=UPI00307CDF84
MGGMQGRLKEVHLARPRGFCAGVVMAIRTVEEALERYGGEGALAVYHEIVHNKTVVERLKSKGVRFVEDLAELPEPGEGVAPYLVLSAHGHPPEVRKEAARRGLTLLDATCPLVTKVHTEARRYAAEGYWILLIGDSADHQEVRGTYGEAPERTILVAVHTHVGRDPRLADPHTVEVPDPERVVVLTQTTLSVDDTLKTIEILKARFPKLVVPARKDLCYATQNRQDAVKRIAPKVQAFLVLTSPHSSNGMRLFELAQRLTGRAYRLESVRELREEWLSGVERLGVTSAASTPEDLVQELLAHLKGRNPGLRVMEEGEEEGIAFRMPRPIPPEEVLGG